MIPTNITSVNDIITGRNKTFVYDNNNRLTEEKTGSQNSIQYEYDANSNIKELKIVESMLLVYLLVSKLVSK